VDVSANQDIADQPHPHYPQEDIMEHKHQTQALTLHSQKRQSHSANS
jgi:hypothetical protein